MIVKMIQDLRRRMEAQIEKTQKMFKQRPWRTKEQTEMNQYNNWNENYSRRSQ